ncbi:LacI family DNA-binding transcriptional regulator [Streptomyces sp. TS71-3]|uniref:LacI family DNA-binding transcriptional regulator n=1 Tax=Streptomyces sp. TS71-3 TaxID=2733862 RepID=UPI001B10E5FC|nr:LacI family DNA-binding transcriptional regulator [Streptomyces sp. TS71-3]GHJ42055.1 LacI family transcriptional regulator [Streptomyces sp. TS71-3]
MSTTNRPRRITIDDVARTTGVSRQTVSRAINDKPEIDPATRQRILTAAQEMGYRPSRFARGMVRQSTTTLGLVIADVLNPFFPEVVAGVLEAADARGWQVVIYTTSSRLSREQEIAETVVDHVDACVAFLLDTAAIGRVAGSGMPFVLLGNEDRPVDVPTIRIDFGSGIRQAFDHLIARGHRRIAMIDDRDRAESEAPDVRSGLFTQVALECGLEVDPRWRQLAGNSMQGGAAAMERLLETAPEVTAVVSYNDMIAIGAMRHALARGRDVPGDCAFVGFDGLALGELVDPPLTTLAIDKRRLGQAAVEQVAEQMAGTGGKGETAIRTQLVVREST